MADLGEDFDMGPGGDLTPDIRMCSGRRALAVSSARRLMTTRGHWPFDPDLGFNLRELINGSGVTSQFLETNIEHEEEKSERTESCTATVNEPARGEIDVRLEDADGPFDLVIGLPEFRMRLEDEDT